MNKESNIKEPQNFLIPSGVSPVYASVSAGTGKFMYEAIDKNSNLKAIVHDYRSLQYLNKISDKEFEFTIRTQMNDVERAFINIVLHEEDNYETVYELERFRDYTNGFDYFKRIIMFDEEIEEIFYLLRMATSQDAPL